MKFLVTRMLIDALASKKLSIEDLEDLIEMLVHLKHLAKKLPMIEASIQDPYNIVMNANREWINNIENLIYQNYHVKLKFIKGNTEGI